MDRVAVQSDGASGLRSSPCMAGNAALAANRRSSLSPTSPTLAGQVVVSCKHETRLDRDARGPMLSTHALGGIGSPAPACPTSVRACFVTPGAKLNSRLPCRAEPAPGQDVQGRQLPVPQRGVRQQSVLHQRGDLRQRRLQLPRWLQVGFSAWHTTSAEPQSRRHTEPCTLGFGHSAHCRPLGDGSARGSIICVPHASIQRHRGLCASGGSTCHPESLLDARRKVNL